MAKQIPWFKQLIKSIQEPENVLIQIPNVAVVIKDKYPKAKHHYLVICKEDLHNIYSVCILEDGRGWGWCFRNQNKTFLFFIWNFKFIQGIFVRSWNENIYHFWTRCIYLRRISLPRQNLTRIIFKWVFIVFRVWNVYIYMSFQRISFRIVWKLPNIGVVLILNCSYPLMVGSLSLFRSFSLLILILLSF